MNAPNAETNLHRFRLHELFTWTVVFAIYGLVLRWSMYDPNLGWVVIAFASIVGTIFWRRYSGSKSNFKNGLLGGTLGGLCSNGFILLLGFLTGNPPTLFMVVVAVLFYIWPGTVLGVLYACVFEELIRSVWRYFVGRKNRVSH